jgi:hypothetical protein
VGRDKAPIVCPVVFPLDVYSLGVLFPLYSICPSLILFSFSHRDIFLSNMDLPNHRNAFGSPTPPRQAAALFITLFFPLLALITFLARMWSRLRVTRCWASGKDIDSFITRFSHTAQMTGSWFLLRYAPSFSLLCSACVSVDP